MVETKVVQVYRVRTIKEATSIRVPEGSSEDEVIEAAMYDENWSEVKTIDTLGYEVYG